MAQVNINNLDPTSVRADPTPAYSADPSGARGVATSNLTWAVAMVLVIAAIAIAVVFVMHHV